MDPRTLQDAIKKRRSGAKLNRDEERALRQAARDQEEKDRWRYYSSIPKKHWVKMSQRRLKELDQQAASYEMPIAGDTINLAAVVTWFHKFLAENHHKLRAPASEDDLVYGGGDSPMLEKLREEMWKLKRLDRCERERNLVSREQLRDGLNQMVCLLRGLGDRLHFRHGAAAAELLNQYLDDVGDLVERLFGNREPHDSR